MGGASRRDVFIVFGVAVFLAGLAWMVGFVTAWQIDPPGPPVPEDIEPPANFSLFGEVWGHVDREFYGDRPMPRDVTYRAIDGLMASLDDPYAAYLDREEAELAVAGVLPVVATSVGVWVEPVTGGALVVSRLPDSPAETAGLYPGDVVIGADGEPLAGLNGEALLGFLDGDAGTEADLVVQMPGMPPRSVVVERGTVDVPAVDVQRHEDGVAYIRISHFSPDVVAELDAALEDLAADPPEGLVIDVRDNPGGDLESLVKVAGRFMSGPVWVQAAGEDDEETHEADGNGAPGFDVPETIVILVNDGTASAAEMFAGALRDAVGAELIGDQTFGKGSIQVIRPLSDRSAMRLTVAQWLTPSREAVDGVGLTPDQTIEGAAEQLEAALEAAAGVQAAGG